MTLAILITLCGMSVPLAAQTLDSTRTLDSVQKASSAKADTIKKAGENWYWVQAGLGFGVLSGFTIVTPGRTSKAEGGLGISSVVGGSVALNSLIISLKLAGVGRIFSSSVTGYGVMCGWIYRDDGWFASFSGGLAYTNMHISRGLFGSSPGENNGTVSITAESQIVTKTPDVGLGLSLFANINLIAPFVGLALNIYLGAMP